MTDSVPSFTIDQCIAYALQHQPLVKQSSLNINITKLTNDISLSGWLPQLNLSGSLTHYAQLPTSFAINSANPAGPPLKVQNGVVNTFIPALSVSQTIYNPGLSLAAKTASLYVKQAQEASDSSKIFIISAVSKTFYGLLLNLQQIDILKEDTIRLAKNVQDSYHQYIGGTSDATDYQTAAITLNNSKSQLRQAVENITPLYASLKQFMGYSPDMQFNVSYDTTKMMQDIIFDTTQQLQYENRIELQQLNTDKSIQNQLISYYKKAYIPTVSAFYNYFPEFENNTFSSLFNEAYPYSYYGLSFTMPIFTGFSRVKNVQKAKLQGQLIDWDIEALKSQVYTEYTTALASYKGNLYNMDIMKYNDDMAKKVYDIVSLQYSQGIVPYLNVVNAETNLISSEIGYINALFQVLSSKIDLEKSMGLINANR
jgi:outer membrane protein TolC